MIVRAMEISDVPQADRVHRLAFGTEFKLPDPGSFRGDAEVVRTRWSADPGRALVADIDGEVVASVLGMDWGSAFIVGPLTVHPEHWNRGIARPLLTEMLKDIKAPLVGLFTHPSSPRHIRLYEGYGFVAQRLTAVMSKTPRPAGGEFERLEDLEISVQQEALAACNRLLGCIFDGLSLSREIAAVRQMSLGNTLLIYATGALEGFAICHQGAGSEAGAGKTFVKFAAAKAAAGFARLLDACDGYAAQTGSTRIVAGVNTGRSQAYQMMKDRGYRADMIGVAMVRGDVAGFNNAEDFVIDDWR